VHFGSPLTTAGATAAGGPSLAEAGAMTLRWTGEIFEQTVVRPIGVDRPWAPSPRTVENAGGLGRKKAKNATPSPENLEADD